MRRVKGNLPQPSYLPAGQDTIPRVLFHALLGQQLVSSIGEGLSNLEN